MNGHPQEIEDDDARTMRRADALVVDLLRSGPREALRVVASVLAQFVSSGTRRWSYDREYFIARVIEMIRAFVLLYDPQVDKLRDERARMVPGLVKRRDDPKVDDTDKTITLDRTARKLLALATESPEENERSAAALALARRIKSWL